MDRFQGSLMDPTQMNSAAGRDLRQGIGVANRTFGELLQGSLAADEDHFLVTLPVNRFSRAVFTPDAHSSEVTVSPAHKYKSRKLIQELLEQYAVETGGHLYVASELPEGKGMASSSADLVAVARAFESSVGFEIPTRVVLELLRTIEPTDGVMYPEFVSFFHRRVELRRRLGAPSRLKVVGLDEGGRIDTIDYNHRNGHFTHDECTEYTVLLDTIEAALLANDLELLGQISTRSAVLNQRRNPKRHLDEMIEIGRATDALGVVVAHSGPCIGLLFPDEPSFEDRVEAARLRVAHLNGDAFVVESLEAGRRMAAHHACSEISL